MKKPKLTREQWQTKKAFQAAARRAARAKYTPEQLVLRFIVRQLKGTQA